MKVSHNFAAASALFDDEHLVSCAGLVPVMTLTTQAGLSQLLAGKIRIAEPRIKSASANPSPKLTTLVAGMCAGADCIDDLDLVRSGGMKTLFDGVYAPSTVGTLLREFTFGHAKHGASYGRTHQDRRETDPAQGPGAVDHHHQHRPAAPVITGARLRAGQDQLRTRTVAPPLCC